MKNKYKINIAWMYPDLMSTYGDRGNIIVLSKRCIWRKVDIDIKTITLETEIEELRTCDLIFMGGAQDRQQKIVSDDFLEKKGPMLKKMIEKGIPALFVCAAYQVVGHYYRPYEGADIKGLGLFDLSTHHPGDQTKRLIGNIAAKILAIDELRGKTIVGFENHGGRTILGERIKPLAKVIKGYGNNGKDGCEGARYKNAIGSYFHGPILPKNPYLADWLIKKSLEIKYGNRIKLQPLDDSLEQHAHNFILSRMGINNYG